MSIENIRAIKANSGQPKPKKVYRLPKKSAKKQAQEAAEKALRNGGETDLQKWYARISKEEKSFGRNECWNCGADLKGYNKGDFIGSIAHVLPKSLFPSVAMHPLNYMILGKWCGCHAAYDSSWEKAQAMKVWGVAKDRFIMIEPDIVAQEERRRIPDCLMETLENSFPDYL